MVASTSSWFMYMIRCGDGSLYTGITTDMERRLREHSGAAGSKRGAKSLRGKRPLALVYQTQLQNRSEAQQMEYIVKQLSKIEKESLVNRTLLLPELVAGKATR